jgi:hypothetical protein
MSKYKISARVDGVMKTHIVDALDADDAAQYGFCMWDVEDVFVEKARFALYESVLFKSSWTYEYLLL